MWLSHKFVHAHVRKKGRWYCSHSGVLHFYKIPPLIRDSSFDTLSFPLLYSASYFVKFVDFAKFGSSSPFTLRSGYCIPCTFSCFLNCLKISQPLKLYNFRNFKAWIRKKVKLASSRRRKKSESLGKERAMVDTRLIFNKLRAHGYKERKRGFAGFRTSRNVRKRRKRNVFPR